MCASELEMLTLQLYLYARRRQPGLVYNPQRIQAELREWGIKSMRELFDMPAEIMSALIFPLLESTVDNSVTAGPRTTTDEPQPKEQQAA